MGFLINIGIFDKSYMLMIIILLADTCSLCNTCVHACMYVSVCTLVFSTVDFVCVTDLTDFNSIAHVSSSGHFLLKLGYSTLYGLP